MQLNEIVEEWLRKAQQDAKSARFLLDMFPPPLEIIGFHAQQAVEKSLKAIIVSTGIDPPRTHDLVFLHTQCIDHAGVDLSMVDLCARLTPYAVDQRYPTNNDLDDEQLVRDVDAAESLAFATRESLCKTETNEP